MNKIIMKKLKKNLASLITRKLILRLKIAE